MYTTIESLKLDDRDRSLDYKITGFNVPRQPAPGEGDDLFAGAQAAVAQMVDLLVARHGIAPVDAYLLCSVCGDLRISEIVHQPNWIVSFYFPRMVLD